MCNAVMKFLRANKIRLLKFAIFLLLVVAIWYVAGMYMVNQYSPPSTANIGFFTIKGLDKAEKYFEFSDKKGERSFVYLRGTVTDTLNNYISHKCVDPGGGLCLEWSNFLQLVVRESWIDDNACQRILWKALSPLAIPVNCFSLKDASWYGGAALYSQRWPIEKAHMDMQPYVSQDILSNKYPQGFIIGSVMERYWINSLGAGIIVDQSVPLHVSLNANNDYQMCFKADYEDGAFFPNPDGQLPVLSYTVCKSKNVRHAHTFLYKKCFDIPMSAPDERMMSKPIWSTWALFKTAVDQAKVLQLAADINKYEFPNSHIEIDDMYSTHYGEFDFNSKKFRNSHQMIGQLKEMGFRVTVWIVPFCKKEAPAFEEGRKNKYWVLDKDGREPAILKWWQGDGYLLDFTNPDACTWFANRLKNMQKEYEIDSFKFDAGEVAYLPTHYKLHTKLNNPSDFTTKYADLVNSFGDMVEMRSAYQSQKYSIFYRLMDKDSHWGYDNGLATVIPGVLLFGLLGYPYVLPDMIGGNAYDGANITKTIFPERELFIRWMQLSAYLPAMQFSITPWHYDDEVVKIAKDIIKVHETIVMPLLLQASKETRLTGKN